MNSFFLQLLRYIWGFWFSSFMHSLGILHESVRTQMLAKPSSNLLQRTGGDHRLCMLGLRTFMMTCLRWILGYMRLEIWCKLGLSEDWRLCTVPCIRSGACYYWIGLEFYALLGRIAQMQPFATDIIYIMWFVCVCWAYWWALQKQPKQYKM